MKRVIAIVLSLLIVVSLAFSVNAAGSKISPLGEKVVFEYGDWAYTKVNNYGYEIDSYKGASTDVTVPVSFGKEYVTTIGEYAFNENTTLTTLNTTKRIEAIGKYAFNGCTSLKTVKLYETLTALGVGCFYGDSALKSVNLSDTSIGSVPAYCFAECGIPSMRLPSTCQSIGHYAFLNCSGLLRVDIPDSVTEIADDAFSGCGNVTIVAPADSAAAQYAQSKGISYIAKENVRMGDANSDNRVNIRDVTAIQLSLVGKFTIEGNSRLFSDINRDGVLNIRDATYIQMHLVGKIADLDNV